MNRKLRHTILAFSVTGMMLALGLMAAQPLPLAPGSGLPATASTQPAKSAAAPRRSAAIRQAGSPPSIHSPGRQHTARADVTASALAIETTAGAVAVIAAEATLAELVQDAATEAVATDVPPARTRRSGSVRHAVAVPYFSFGRGGRS